MNREILFRGKRVATNSNNGEWVYGFLVTGIHTTWIFTGDVNSSGLYPSWDKIVVDPETVGQFTGLLDKNGNRIFEGDSLTATVQGTSFGKIHFIVKYETDGFSVYPRNFKNVPPLRLSDLEDLEITGNVHDNEL